MGSCKTQITCANVINICFLYFNSHKYEHNDKNEGMKVWNLPKQDINKVEITLMH